jgi:hypothetical protein
MGIGRLNLNDLTELTAAENDALFHLFSPSVTIVNNLDLFSASPLLRFSAANGVGVDLTTKLSALHDTDALSILFRLLL